MSLRFRAASEPEAPQIRACLLAGFKARDTAPTFHPAHLAWKYFEPHPLWEGSRSYVYEQDAGLIAHACAWPFSLNTPAGALAGVHPIDWVASNAVPGGGALLLRSMRALRDVSICVGGTPIARTVIAQTGYKARGEMEFFARPLRPWRQFTSHQHRNWKLPVRLARNAWWTLAHRPAPARGWSARRIPPEHLPAEALPAPGPEAVVAGRSVELFQYFLRCPAARYELYLVSQGARPAGYFLLSYVPGQARIADAWGAEGSREAWKNVFQLAVRAATAEGSAAEIAAAACLAPARAALADAGFRRYDSMSIMLFDPRRRIADGAVIHLQMIDNDFSFLHGGSPSYVT